MYTSARTIPFTELNIMNCQTPKGKTLVADVSSCFLSEPMDVAEIRRDLRRRSEKYRTCRCTVIVIIREDLIRDDVCRITYRLMLKYKTQADKGSLYNTPPCYGIYICGKVFKWLKKSGRSGSDEETQRGESSRFCMISLTTASCSKVLSAKKTVP